jgi:hypothetical protein
MFELPALTPGIDPTLPADKKQLAEWLKAGEGRDISATIRRVYDTLKGLNRAALSDKNRFAMLELLAETIATIAATLERHYAGLDQPLPPPNRKIAQSLGRLLRQYTIGYQRLVADAMEQSGRFDQASMYVIAHARVMRLSADSINGLLPRLPGPARRNMAGYASNLPAGQSAGDAPVTPGRPAADVSGTGISGGFAV